MRIEVNLLESGTEPRVSVQDQSALMVALRAGSSEVGSRCSEMMRFAFGAGEMRLVPHRAEAWFRTDDLLFAFVRRHLRRRASGSLGCDQERRGIAQSGKAC